MTKADARVATRARQTLFLGYAVLVVVLLGPGFWAVSATITQPVVANGTLRPAGGRSPVAPAVDGVIDRVIATEGRSVRAGDPLVMFERGDVLDALAAVERRIFSDEIDRLRLLAERDGRPAPDLGAADAPKDMSPTERQELIEAARNQFAARIRAAEAADRAKATEIESLASQTREIRASATGIDAEIAILRDELSRREALRAKALVTAASLADLRLRLVRLQAQREGLAERERSLRNRLSAARAERQAARADRMRRIADGLHEIARRRPELEARRAALERKLRRLTVRAPVSGRVLGLRPLAPGQAVGAGDMLMTVVPDAAVWEVVVRLPRDQAARLKDGQTAFLTVVSAASAQPIRGSGHVARIGADALVDRATGRRFFELAISLPAGFSETLKHDGIRPGGGVTVSIPTQRQSPLSVLLSRVLASRSPA